MKMIDLDDQAIRKAFALEAAEYFSEHPHCYTYTHSKIESGALFALRFGLGKDCVVVFKIDEFAEVENYQNIIKE